MDIFYQSFSSLFTNHSDGTRFCQKGGLLNISIPDVWQESQLDRCRINTRKFSTKGT